jgi:hypothetical protein
MEKYSFEKAQEEAGKTKLIAQDIKDKRTSGWDEWRKPDDPSNEDYRRADALIDSGYEENLVSYIESYKLAKELLEKYKDQLIEKEYENEDIDDVIGSNQSIKKFLEKIPDEIKAKYRGHGITKGNETDQLAAMINIAQNKCIVGAEGNLAFTGRGISGAYKNGYFLVISKLDKHLLKRKLHLIKGPSSMFEGNKIQQSDENGEREASEADIGAIVVNLKFYPLVEELRKLFPDIKIIKANEIVDHIMNEVDHPKI